MENGMNIENLKKVKIEDGEALFFKVDGGKYDSQFLDELGKVLKCKIFLINDWDNMRIIKLSDQDPQSKTCGNPKCEAGCYGDIEAVPKGKRHFSETDAQREVS
jgi:hypothetical protein